MRNFYAAQSGITCVSQTAVVLVAGSMPELGICGMHHHLATLLWLGILKTSS